MYLYSLLQHYKNWKQDKEEIVLGLRSVHIFILPSLALQKQEAKQYAQHLQHYKTWTSDNTHSTFSFTNNGSQTIHTASSASRKPGARQYTQHLQIHKKWEPDDKHSIFSFTNNGSQTIHTASSVSQ